MWKFFSSPQMHARWQHQIPDIPTTDSRGVQNPTFSKKLFPWMPNLKFSQVGGGVQNPTFSKDAKSEVFPGGGGGGVGVRTQLFSSMPNFRSKFFPFTKCSGLCFFQVGGGGGFRPNFIQGCQISGQKFSPLPSALDSVFFSGGGGGGCSDPIFFKDAKFQVKNFFPLPSALDSVFLRWWDAVMQNLGSEEIGSFGNYSLTRGGQCLVIIAKQYFFTPRNYPLS